MELAITEIIRITNLVKKVNCCNYALVAEVAKEMGVKKTALMQYIIDNPKLFDCCEYAPKGKVKGLAIHSVYPTPYENPLTDEWLGLMKAKWAKKLHVFGKYYYGVLEFYYIDIDRTKDYNRFNEYRNTEEKIKELEDAGILKRETCGYGGFGDYSKVDTFRVTEELLEKLAAAGWTTDYEEVNAKVTGSTKK